MRSFGIYAFLCVILISCKSIKTSLRQPVKPAVEDAKQKEFQLTFSNKENEDGSYILYYRNHKKIEDLFPSVEFFIYEKQSSNIVYRDTLKAGSVKWYSAFEIIAVERNIKVESSNKPLAPITYLYHVGSNHKQLLK